MQNVTYVVFQLFEMLCFLSDRISLEAVHEYEHTVREVVVRNRRSREEESPLSCLSRESIHACYWSASSRENTIQQRALEYLIG